jgi:hypothetical protein
MATLGFTGALGNITLDTRIMQNGNKEMLARVTSVSRLASFSACAIGTVLGGLLVQKFGVQSSMDCLFLLTPVLLLSARPTREPGRPGGVQARPVRDAREKEEPQADESRWLWELLGSPLDQVSLVRTVGTAANLAGAEEIR